MKVRKAVITATGRSIRMNSASTSMHKELFPSLMAMT